MKVDCKRIVIPTLSFMSWWKSASDSPSEQSPCVQILLVAIGTWNASFSCKDKKMIDHRATNVNDMVDVKRKFRQKRSINSLLRKFGLLMRNEISAIFFKLQMWRFVRFLLHFELLCYYCEKFLFILVWALCWKFAVVENGRLWSFEIMASKKNRRYTTLQRSASTLTSSSVTSSKSTASTFARIWGSLRRSHSSHSVSDGFKVVHNDGQINVEIIKSISELDNSVVSFNHSNVQTIPAGKIFTRDGSRNQLKLFDVDMAEIDSWFSDFVWLSKHFEGELKILQFLCRISQSRDLKILKFDHDLSKFYWRTFRLLNSDQWVQVPRSKSRHFFRK